MDVVLVAAGALVVGAVGSDIGVTMLHPTARAPLSYVANRSVWRGVKALSRSRRSLSYAGPVAMLANMLMWVGGLWLGFALIYGSGMSVGDAIYTSGEALTTVGFGHQQFDPEWLRYVGVVEAAAGFGVFSAAITYVLSVYPLVTQLRRSALYVADLGMEGQRGAATLAQVAGVAEMPSLIRDLIEDHEHVKRFPVLYYFESGDEHESIATLLKGAALMCTVLTADDVPGELRVYGEALQRTLERLFDDLEREFIGGRFTGITKQDDFVERADHVIGSFAAEHRQRYDGLLNRSDADPANF